MGTRGFVGFVADGTEKIAYNHSDSYPSGLGVAVLDWLREVNVDQAAKAARRLRVVASSSKPTAEDVQRLSGFAARGVSGGDPAEEWYVLLRETQGDPGAILEAGVIEDNGSFPQDSLFAEWGYLVDFDASRFEVYKGFQKEPHTEGRFADRPPATNGYYPVRLVGSWPLDRLASEDDILSLEARDGDE